jgi:hypothetical protein
MAVRIELLADDFCHEIDHIRSNRCWKIWASVKCSNSFLGGGVSAPVALKSSKIMKSASLCGSDGNVALDCTLVNSRHTNG